MHIVVKFKCTHKRSHIVHNTHTLKYFRSFGDPIADLFCVHLPRLGRIKANCGKNNGILNCRISFAKYLFKLCSRIRAVCSYQHPFYSPEIVCIQHGSEASVPRAEWLCVCVRKNEILWFHEILKDIKHRNGISFLAAISTFFEHDVEDHYCFLCVMHAYYHYNIIINDLSHCEVWAILCNYMT